MKHVLGRFIIFFITVYSILLFLRIILSWIRLPEYRWVYWLCKFTDPVIDFFRRNFPIRIGMFDISIATPLILLSVLGKLTNDFLISDEPFISIFNIWYVLILIIFTTKLIFNFVLFILIIFTFVLLIAKLLAPNVQNPLISTFQSLLDPMLNFLDKNFKIRSPRSEIIYLIIILIFLFIINGLGSFLLEYSNAIIMTNLRAAKTALKI